MSSTPLDTSPVDRSRHRGRWPINAPGKLLHAIDKSAVSRQSGSNPMGTRYATLTWKTTDGTTYTVSGDKVSGTNGLKLPSGTASPTPTASK